MGADYPAVTGVEIVPFRPREVDEIYLANISKTQGVKLPPVAYVVKIVLDTLPQFGAAGMDVAVGDEVIRRYGTFARGIFLLVHDPDFLRRHADDPIRFIHENDAAPHDTGARLPRDAAAPAVAFAASMSGPRTSFAEAVERTAPGSAGAVP